MLGNETTKNWLYSLYLAFENIGNLPNANTLATSGLNITESVFYYYFLTSW